MENLVEKLLQCPDCKKRMVEDLQCPACGRRYGHLDGIFQLLPSHDPLPSLSVFADPHYQKYQALHDKKDDYFYRNPNPVINWVQASGYRVIRDLLGEEPGMILECGCGTGVFADLYPGLNRARYVMSDLDEESLKQIKNKEKLGGVVQATSYVLPFQDQAFDVVLSHAHLEHLPYLDHGLEEVRRVLKPEGRFIASVPNEGGLFWSRGRDMSSARHFSRRLGIDYIRANRIDHFNTVYQIDRALRRYFRVEKRVFFPFFWPSFHFNLTTTYVLRPLVPARV